MGIRLTKPWLDLASLDTGEIPGQLGVFQLASAEGVVLYIGYAGGNELFGLRSAIPAAVEAVTEAVASGASETPALVRYELTSGYLSRWEELLMIHLHDAGERPPGNGPLDHPRGRLTPDLG